MAQKNIAIAYDRLIFLEDGEYEISGFHYTNVDGATYQIMKNRTNATFANALYHSINQGQDRTFTFNLKEFFSRGDYVYFFATNIGTNAISGTNPTYQQLNITKIN